MNLYLLGLLIGFAIFIANSPAIPFTLLLTILWALLAIFDARRFLFKKDTPKDPDMYRLVRRDYPDDESITLGYVWGDLQDFEPTISGYSIERMDDVDVKFYERGML